MLPFVLSRPTDTPLRVVCFGAHSDDIEIGCGGTILELIKAYPAIDITWVVLSGQGDRARETVDSAARFLAGVESHRVIMREFRDGYFPEQFSTIKDEFESIRRQVSPDIVFAHYRQDRHQDHRVVSDLAWNTFRNHLILEYEIPKYDGDLGQPNLFVPLSSSICDAKVNHLLAGFPSQSGKPWFDRETFLALARLRGVECHSPSRYAEAFYSRKFLLCPSQGAS